MSDGAQGLAVSATSDLKNPEGGSSANAARQYASRVAGNITDGYHLVNKLQIKILRSGQKARRCVFAPTAMLISKKVKDVTT